MTTTGKCLCGAVSLVIDADPVTARQCWCTVCQSLAAGNSAVNVIFPTEAVTTTGEVRWYESVADSGNQMRRGFCPTCGTPLFSIAEARPHLTIIRAGALNDRGAIAPQAIIWADSAPKWAKLDPDLPHFPGQP
ncbi:MAG TPA: GFA family protein [Sphingobium sp.]